MATVMTFLVFGLALIGAFALVATITPNKHTNKVLDVFYKFINFCGANFGKASNGE